MLEIGKIYQFNSNPLLEQLMDKHFYRIKDDQCTTVGPNPIKFAWDCDEMSFRNYVVPIKESKYDGSILKFNFLA